MRNLAIFIALVFLTSCAQVPKESAYLLGYQHKMQASKHWDKLARKVAADVKSAVGDEKAQIFMSDVDYSPFGKAMRTLLITAFHRKHLVLTTVETVEESTYKYKLVCEVQPVFHAAYRENTYGGLPTFLLLEIPQFILLGENDWYGGKPHSEVIITYELWKKNEKDLKSSLCLRTSKIFYVNDADREEHYWDTSRRGIVAMVPHPYHVEGPKR